MEDGNWTVFIKMTDINVPPPAKAWVFLDEREDSINDGYFVVDMNGYPDKSRSWYIVDYRRSTTIGRAASPSPTAIRKFEMGGPQTLLKLKKGQELSLNVPSPGNADVFWLQERSTGK